MLLKTDYSVLQYREHQHSLRTKMKTPSVGRLKLGVDQDIGLKNHHRPILDERAP
jgi:hypothetical protein